MAMNWTVKVRPEIWTDPRFRLLERRSTDRWQAVGKLVEFWQLAQGHWAVGENIPEARFRLLEIPEIIECGFAVQMDDGSVRAKGSDEHFSWLLEQRERGKKSAAARLAKYGTAQPKKRANPEPDSNQTRTMVHTGSTISRTESNQELEQEQELELRIREAKASLANVSPLAPDAPIKDEPIEVKKDRTPYADFAAVWNKHRGVLPACTRMTQARRNKIKSRLAEEPDLAYWESVIVKLASSSFACSGKWCNFDWLIWNDTNHVKASEGKYDDKQQPSRLAGSVDDFLADLNKLRGGK